MEWRPARQRPGSGRRRERRNSRRQLARGRRGCQYEERRLYGRCTGHWERRGGQRGAGDGGHRECMMHVSNRKRSQYWSVVH